MYSHLFAACLPCRRSKWEQCRRCVRVHISVFSCVCAVARAVAFHHSNNVVPYCTLDSIDGIQNYIYDTRASFEQSENSGDLMQSVAKPNQAYCRQSEWARTASGVWVSVFGVCGKHKWQPLRRNAKKERKVKRDKITKLWTRHRPSMQCAHRKQTQKRNDLKYLMVSFVMCSAALLPSVSSASPMTLIVLNAAYWLRTSEGRTKVSSYPFLSCVDRPNKPIDIFITIKPK